MWFGLESALGAPRLVQTRVQPSLPSTYRRAKASLVGEVFYMLKQTCCKSHCKKMCCMHWAAMEMRRAEAKGTSTDRVFFEGVRHAERP